MPIYAVGLNGMADWLAERAPFLALHSADPGPTGMHETAAARIAANWPASVNGVLTLGSRVFSGGQPLGPITHLGLWSASSGGIIYASGLLSGDQQFNANGIYNLLNVAINGASG